MIGRTGEETQQRWLLIAVIVCTTPRMRVGTLELGRAKSYQQLTDTKLCLGSLAENFKFHTFTMVAETADQYAIGDLESSHHIFYM
jgi:hypothetical protein